MEWIGIGWSMGAVCLFEACLERPSAFNALVGCGATASFCSRPGYDAGIAVERVQAMLTTLKKKPALILHTFFRDAYFPGQMTETLLHSRIESGILLRPVGNIVYLMLPLITPEQVILSTVEALAKAIKGHL